MSKTTKTKKIVEEPVKKTAPEVISEVNQNKIVTEPTVPHDDVIASETKQSEGITNVKTVKKRGKKYLDARAKIDINKFYPLKEAVELIKKVSISRFDGKIEAHLTTLEAGNIGEIVFPHLETASKKIMILNDTVFDEIKDGKINFDILIATPATMPRLLPFARLLGPKGLMPNPKNGTLTDKPEEAVKRLSVAKIVVKTEKKAPIVHLVVGKVSQPIEELVANVKELIKVVKIPRIKKLVLCPTMGPGIKVEIAK